MSDLVAATRTEVHQLRNDLGARISHADAEIAELRDKEWRCQRRMARWEGVARANGWEMPPDEDWGAHDPDRDRGHGGREGPDLSPRGSE